MGGGALGCLGAVRLVGRGVSRVLFRRRTGYSVARGLQVRRRFGSVGLPNALALASVPLVVIGLELQVRKWEEPYLLRVGGDEWVAYASRVGRFLPRLGRVSDALRDA